MYVSTLGQTQQTTTTTTSQIVYRPSSSTSSWAIAPMYYPAIYPPGVSYARSEAPGLPYTTQFNPEEIEKNLYKDLPQDTKDEQAVTGTEPQKIVRLKSGLEVPAYILQRDAARKQIEAQKAAEIANAPLPRFYKVGIYATQQPAKAALFALIFGYIAGNIVYNLRRK